MISRSPAAMALVLVCVVQRPMSAQGYRVRLDVGGQAAAYRGVQLDSIARADVINRAIGGPSTPDGFAVRCLGVDPFCRFFRPGATRSGGPVTAAANFAVWGVGVPGLSARGTARLGADLGDSDAWPGARPSAQLLEGFLEYATGPVTVQAGRQQRLSRLGAVGFDGGQVTVRVTRLHVEAGAYGGWSLGQASALPTTSPALNPLDEYQPRRRFLTAGGELAASTRWGNARGVYQRQVDPTSDYFVSERAGFDVTLMPPVAGLTLSGGADYDMARGLWGSSEGSVTFVDGPVAASVGARRHRPYFDLWTIWGAFSPVPYRAEFGSLRVKLLRGLTVSGRGETYRYNPAEADAPLVEVKNEGWRWSAEVRYAPVADLEVNAGGRVEFGPGASSRGFDAGVTYRRERFEVSAYGMALERPLEFRFDEAQVWAIGASGMWRPTEQWSAAAGLSRYVETRDRPDAAAFDWNQLRAYLRISLTFGSSADRETLPPARPSRLSPLPDGRRGRASSGK
jgi:hypothetical protein